MAMQIGGTDAYARINQYSRNAKAGEKPQELEANGAVSGGKKPETEETKKEMPAMPGSKAAAEKKEDPQKAAQVQSQIQELVQIQNKVIMHEQAHMSAGGDLAGGASYSYTTGPDGKRYITGGEVSISTPSVKEPEEKIRIMARVQAAALAPADPSPQDMRVAASASAKQAQASIELTRKRAEAAYESTKDKADPRIPGTPKVSQDDSEAMPVKQPKKTPPGSLLDLSL